MGLQLLVAVWASGDEGEPSQDLSEVLICAPQAEPHLRGKLCDEFPVSEFL